MVEGRKKTEKQAEELQSYSYTNTQDLILILFPLPYPSPFFAIAFPLPILSLRGGCLHGNREMRSFSAGVFLRP